MFVGEEGERKETIVGDEISFGNTATATEVQLRQPNSFRDKAQEENREGETQNQERTN